MGILRVEERIRGENNDMEKKKGQKDRQEQCYQPGGPVARPVPKLNTKYVDNFNAMKTVLYGKLIEFTDYN